MARSRLVLAAVVAAAAAVASSAAARPAGPFSLSGLHPVNEPPGWIPLVPASRTSLLWYPPFMTSQPGDPYSVTAALKDAAGKVTLVYLNAGPKTGPETMSDWPSSRIDHLREEGDKKVHEEQRAAGIPFHGGTGSCVLDDYVTRRAPHHYREIACFVQGRTTASVIVATALESAWPKYGAQLVRAVEAWQVK